MRASIVWVGRTGRAAGTAIFDQIDDLKVEFFVGSDCRSDADLGALGTNLSASLHIGICGYKVQSSEERSVSGTPTHGVIVTTAGQSRNLTIAASCSS